MNKYLKKALCLTVAIVYSTCAIIPISANDYTIGRSYVWSPYSTETSVNILTNTVNVWHGFYFDQTGTAEINSWNNSYYTSEINCENGKPLILAGQYTSLPDPHFDTDDDDGDGYDEEIEVTVGPEGTLTAMSNYYHNVVWLIDGNVGAGGINFYAQKSYKSLLGEYNSMISDFLAQTIHAPINSVYSNSQPQILFNETQTSNGENDISKMRSNKSIVVSPQLNSLDDLDKYRAEQNTQLAKIREKIATKNTESTLNQSAISTYGTIATVTFCSPISVSTLQSILSKTGTQLVDCEIKYLDANETWITGNVNNLQSLNRMTVQIRADLGDEIEYCGITSARLIVDLLNNSIESLNNDTNVFFVDIMDEIVRQNTKSNVDNLNVIVFDLAWFLDKFNN